MPSVVGAVVDVVVADVTAAAALTVVLQVVVAAGSYLD